MTYLLADSGATKTEWIVFDAQGIRETIRTGGINPMVQSEVQIRTGPLRDLDEVLRERQITKVFFYGAGLRTADKVQLMTRLLGEILPHAELEVEHDLLGAARAVCHREEGIVCILGTGSNSCWFDGKNIVAELGGHGYLLGDEGSGADLGKALVKAALDQELPAKLIAALEAHTGKTLLQIRNGAYQHERPNFYFSRFSHFIKENIDDPAIRMLVISRFSTFLSKTVLKYRDNKKLKVHFVGSVGEIYQFELAKAIEMLQLTPGRVLRAPAEELVRYHLEGLKD